MPEGRAPEEFWSSVEVGGPDECWPWTGPRLPEGYGRATVAGVRVYTHRFAWSLATGREIPLGLLVCHTCDNPPCVNPAHLWLGTYTDNARDRDRKGRASSIAPPRLAGENANGAKLTTRDVVELRRLSADGVPSTALARQFGVSERNVRFVVSRVTWADVP